METLNSITDLNDLIEIRQNKTYGGYCTSLKCCEYFAGSGKKEYRQRILKNIGTVIETCPDCRNTLVFREVKYGQKVGE